MPQLEEIVTRQLIYDIRRKQIIDKKLIRQYEKENEKIMNNMMIHELKKKRN